MTESPSDGLQDQERTHPEEPAEGGTDGNTEENDIRRLGVRYAPHRLALSDTWIAIERL